VKSRSVEIITSIALLREGYGTALRFGYHWLIVVYQSVYEPATDQVQKCMKTLEIIYDAFTA